MSANESAGRRLDSIHTCIRAVHNCGQIKSPPCVPRVRYSIARYSTQHITHERGNCEAGPDISPVHQSQSLAGRY